MDLIDQIVWELGKMSVDVRYEIGGAEKREPEDLRGAVEHATAYPCMVEMDPGCLLENLKHRVKGIVEKAVAASHTYVGPRPPPTSVVEAERKEGREAAAVVGIDVASEPDRLVATIACPCGSRASISSKKITLGELSLFGDWAKEHQRHVKGAG